jgi:hypothetical protein
LRIDSLECKSKASLKSENIHAASTRSRRPTWMTRSPSSGRTSNGCLEFTIPINRVSCRHPARDLGSEHGSEENLERHRRIETYDIHTPCRIYDGSDGPDSSGCLPTVRILTPHLGVLSIFWSCAFTAGDMPIRSVMSPCACCAPTGSISSRPLSASARNSLSSKVLVNAACSADLRS